MFLERRIDRLVTRLKQSVSLPLRLELWNGRIFDFSSEPTVRIGVPSPSALRFLISPDLMKLGYAYVEGHLRVPRRRDSRSRSGVARPARPVQGLQP